MKKSVLVLLIVSLIVFAASLTAGIALTLRTVGWQNLSDSSQISAQLENLFSQVRWFDFQWGPSESYAIDDEHVIDLDNISEIHISGLSENIVIDASADQIQARLFGQYRSRGGKIDWQAANEDGILTIEADYPRFGLMNSNLEIEINIPAEFTGEVYINTLSGDISQLEQGQLDWTRFEFGSLSGDLHLDNARLDAVYFSTLSGKVLISQVDARISGDTMSGNVTINLDILQPLYAKTLSGNIDISLPADSNADIDFATLSGSFEASGLSVQFQKQEKRELIAMLNNGGVGIEVETMSGDFTLTAR